MLSCSLNQQQVNLHIRIFLRSAEKLISEACFYIQQLLLCIYLGEECHLVYFTNLLAFRPLMSYDISCTATHYF